MKENIFHKKKRKKKKKKKLIVHFYLKSYNKKGVL